MANGEVAPDSDTTAAVIEEEPDKVEKVSKEDGNLAVAPTEAQGDTSSKPPHTRQPSLSLQSRLRSSSFRHGSISQAPLSPTTNGGKPLTLPALSPEGDAVTEIYRKQAFRIDELERENKRLAKESKEAEARWRKAEEELEELRESNSEIMELRSRAAISDARSEEINKLVLPCISHYIQDLTILQSEIRSDFSTTPDFTPPIPIHQEHSACIFS